MDTNFNSPENPPAAPKLLTVEQIELTIRALNNELTGFRGWGWLEFARAIERLSAARVAELEAALLDCVTRMDRARDILTDGKPTPQCNWGMLDTNSARAILAGAPVSPSSVARVAELAASYERMGNAAENALTDETRAALRVVVADLRGALTGAQERT
jgi:hypothetical protein